MTTSSGDEEEYDDEEVSTDTPADVTSFVESLKAVITGDSDGLPFALLSAKVN